MAGEQAVEATKSKTVYTTVKMEDGRDVQFAGKRKMNKETLIDSGRVELDEAAGILQVQKGAISIRMDFLNGSTRTFELPLALVAKFAGHGAEQKYGDELASPADKPLTPEDMVIAVEALDGEIQGGKWGKGRAEGGGGVAGAGVVVQAILEVTNASLAAAGKPLKDIAFVKAYLQKRLDTDKDLTRRALYDSFRAPASPTAAVIKRIEEEKLSKTAKVDTGAALAEMAE